MTTEQYPFEPKVTKPRYHGRHVLNRHPDGLEKCVGCELCAWACPADAIYVEGGDNTEDARFSPGERYGAVYQINYLRCIFCGLCIEACPTRSLTMSNDFELADDNRQDLIYTKEQLMAPLLPGMEAAAAPDAPGRRREGLLPAGAGLVAGRAGHRGEGMSLLAAAADTQVVIGGAEEVVFWILGPIALAGALGMVFSSNAVHSALWLVMTMLSLGVFYVVQEAPFLGAVQIIVYTGAIMILFLFVLMMVGRDSSDSVVETLRGQRVAATVLGIGFAGLVGAGIARATQDLPVTGLADAEADAAGGQGGNIPAIAELLFTRYLLAFEVTSALLITAAVGAMVLAHIEREPGTRRTQKELSKARFLDTPGPRRCPAPVSTPAATRSRRPRCCPTGRSPRRASPPGSSPRRSTRCPGPPAAGSSARPTGRSAPSTPRPWTEASDDTDLLPGARGDPLHDRRRRRAGPPQRHRRVHVRRADAQLGEPDPGHVRARPPAPSTARSWPSS